ncbi:MAG: molybdenum cofactor biosynthesis protein MoaE [Bacteroidota bacterium]|nr:molybdenum cofactor biosynthesis protein MoaE [Bacteroidota bacterium]
MVRIQEAKIHVEEILGSVVVPEAGGVDVFIGTTRNHANGKNVVALHYEAYVPMALEMMRGIEKELYRRWKIRAAAIVHRVGEVPVTEASVVIAVSADHRADAFAACRYAIDTLKKDVPIWKKEIFEDGEAWAENIEARFKIQDRSIGYES